METNLNPNNLDIREAGGNSQEIPVEASLAEAVVSFVAMISGIEGLGPIGGLGVKLVDLWRGQPTLDDHQLVFKILPDPGHALLLFERRQRRFTSKLLGLAA